MELFRKEQLNWFYQVNSDEKYWGTSKTTYNVIHLFKEISLSVKNINIIPPNNYKHL